MASISCLVGALTLQTLGSSKGIPTPSFMNDEFNISSIEGLFSGLGTKIDFIKFIASNGTEFDFGKCN